MERKIGDTFEFEGRKFEVKEVSNGCDGCFLKEKCCIGLADLVGTCGAGDRTDKKNVVFVEVQEQHNEQPQKLNLCELLKHCPNGEQFWSPMLGDVKYCYINHAKKEIDVKLASGAIWGINADGTITVGDVISSEIMLYPSREQRDWTKVKFEPKKDKFDPKTLKPFDKVLTRDSHNEKWCCNIFSNIDDNRYSKYITVSYGWKYCIPYNDDTKHLVGTKDEAPDFYRYWEE